MLVRRVCNRDLVEHEQDQAPTDDPHGDRIDCLLDRREPVGLFLEPAAPRMGKAQVHGKGDAEKEQELPKRRGYANLPHFHRVEERHREDEATTRRAQEILDLVAPAASLVLLLAPVDIARRHDGMLTCNVRIYKRER